MVVKGYEDNLGAPLRAVREDVEREWSARLTAEETKRKEAEAWAAELARALEKEKKVCIVPNPRSSSTHIRPFLRFSFFTQTALPIPSKFASGLTSIFFYRLMCRHGSS